MFSPAGASASELVLQCTPEGIRLQCYMSYYTEEMKTVWKHKYAAPTLLPHVALLSVEIKRTRS